MLFTVYLEAALRDLRSRLPTRPLADANLPLDVEYADDTDFISTSCLFLDDIERIAPACLAEWSLTINAHKTERSSVCRNAVRVDEEWRMTRKLGSLLGEAEDVARTTVAINARSSAFTGRIAYRTRRYIAAVDVAPSAVRSFAIT